jgi:serine/threonine-protein kinase RsbW
MLGEQVQPSMTPHPHPSFRLVIAADPLSVRSALQAVFDSFPVNGLDADTRGTVEIVLAEALNNIVEHAYANFPGEIDLKIEQIGQRLHCTLRDQGVAMPNLTLPDGTLPAFETDLDAPEGGFGWHLIRALATDLHYQREGATNLLHFRLDIDPAKH